LFLFTGGWIFISPWLKRTRSLLAVSLLLKEISQFLNSQLSIIWVWVGFELIALVVIATDCICSCKSNYHRITTTTVPEKQFRNCWNLNHHQLFSDYEWK
jgi:hypothetical protein